MIRYGVTSGYFNFPSQLGLNASKIVGPIERILCKRYMIGNMHSFVVAGIKLNGI
jgi:hypothetical protein